MIAGYLGAAGGMIYLADKGHQFYKNYRDDRTTTMIKREYDDRNYWLNGKGKDQIETLPVKRSKAIKVEKAPSSLTAKPHQYAKVDVEELAKVKREEDNEEEEEKEEEEEDEDEFLERRGVRSFFQEKSNAQSATVKPAEKPVEKSSASNVKPKRSVSLNLKTAGVGFAAGFLGTVAYGLGKHFAEMHKKKSHGFSHRQKDEATSLHKRCYDKCHRCKHDDDDDEWFQKRASWFPSWGGKNVKGKSLVEQKANEKPVETKADGTGVEKKSRKEKMIKVGKIVAGLSAAGAATGAMYAIGKHDGRKKEEKRQAMMNLTPRDEDIDEEDEDEDDDDVVLERRGGWFWGKGKPVEAPVDKPVEGLPIPVTPEGAKAEAPLVAEKDANKNWAMVGKVAAGLGAVGLAGGAVHGIHQYATSGDDDELSKRSQNEEREKVS